MASLHNCTTKMPRVAFCEPVTTSLRDDREYLEETAVELSGELVNWIKTHPPVVVERVVHEEHPHHKVRAYIFGPNTNVATQPELFRDYDEIASHSNDAAQTGLILLDVPVAQGQEPSEVLYQLCEEEEREEYYTPTPELVAEVRARAPSCLWYGETPGGDVGAVLFARVGADGSYDSLIVDVGYFDDSADSVHGGDSD
jgi:hypothetical protein